jgi:hypothetical protein
MPELSLSHPRWEVTSSWEAQKIMQAKWEAGVFGEQEAKQGQEGLEVS